MDSWSATEDDRPPRISRPERGGDTWLWIVFAAALVAVVLAAGYSYFRELQPQSATAPEAPAVAAPAAEAPAPPAAAAPEAVRHPVPAEEAEPSLPALDHSDALARESLVDLLGGKAFNELVIPAQLVRRIVATVDNLPRETAPRRAIPLEPVPGAFIPGSADNSARYAPYVRVFEAIDTPAMVKLYVRTYPLFQRAYEELGFPGRYFNDRLVEAIDDMLAAPELAGPPELVQEKVLYQFADPAHEKRSAGQKVLMRMGPENAARVKAKLREMRGALGALRKPS